MDAEAGSPLPWEALKRTEGDIPRPALERFADALAEDASILHGLRELYGRSVTSAGERPGYECLYVPAIIAMAAPRLNEPSRREAAAFLVEELVAAGEKDDDLLLRVLVTACGSLGPAALPAVLDAMPYALEPWNVTLSLLALTVLAVKTNDTALRDRAITICEKAIRKAEWGDVDVYTAAEAAWTLAAMGHRDARPPLQRLYDRTKSPDIRDALDLMDGSRRMEPRGEPWDGPVDAWLEIARRSLQYRRAKRDGSRDEQIVFHADSFRSEWEAELPARFAGSPAAAELSDDLREDAASIVGSLLTCERFRPKKLNETALREVLLETFPRSAAADREVLEKVAPVTQAFLGWLESEGILRGAAPLVEAVGRWADAIVAHAMDPHHWGKGKGPSGTTAAGAKKVEPKDTEPPLRIKTPRTVEPARRRPAEKPADKKTVEPIVKAAPKVGRNDPCPCGSGKKYKKCCGR